MADQASITIGWREKAAAKRPFSTCKGCGRLFQPRGVDRTTFCSRACAFAFKTANKASPEELECRRLQRNPPAQAHTVACEQCGAIFSTKTAAKVCSEECRKAKARDQARRKNMAAVGVKRHSCKECGIEFSPPYGKKSRAYCSDGCAKRAGKRNAPRGSDRKRARAFGVEYQYVNPLKVLRRDNWTCQLCGRRTPEHLRGTFDPRAPEVDHVQPISKGGAHTYANLQCACRACNQAKGDAPMGQLNLFAS